MAPWKQTTLEGAKQLVVALSELAVCLQTANMSEQKTAVEKFLEGPAAKLLLSDWQQDWNMQGILYSGCFCDLRADERAWAFLYAPDERDDRRTWDHLYATVRSIVCLHLSAASPHLHRKYAAVAVDNIAEFLGFVGLPMPVIETRQELITMVQAAELCGCSAKTLRNYSGAGRPPASVPARGNRPAYFDYSKLRPWLLEKFPEMNYRLPEDFDQAMRILAGD